MDIPKISHCFAQGVVGLLLGLLFLLTQIGVSWINNQLHSWWLLAFLIHLLNGATILGLLSLAIFAAARKTKNPARRLAMLVDLVFVLCIFSTLWYVWLRG